MKLVLIESAKGIVSVWERNAEIARFKYEGEIDLDTILELLQEDYPEEAA